MTRSYIDKDEAVAAVRACVPEVAGAIRNIDDPNAIAVGQWTTSDVAAHLVDAAEDNLKAAQGLGTPYGTTQAITATNEERLAARAERDPKVLASLYEQALESYLSFVEGVDGDPIIPWTDFKVPLSTLLAADLGEYLIHGWDIAHAEGKPWTIDPYRAALLGKGISPMTVNYVDEDAARGFSGVFDVRMRGYWAQHYVFTDGVLAIEDPADRRVDVHISADPVAFMLVGYGRISQWGPIATGKLLTWGRKPWLAFKFASLLRNP